MEKNFCINLIEYDDTLVEKLFNKMFKVVSISKRESENHCWKMLIETCVDNCQVLVSFDFVPAQNDRKSYWVVSDSVSIVTDSQVLLSCKIKTLLVLFLEELIYLLQDNLFSQKQVVSNKNLMLENSIKDLVQELGDFKTIKYFVEQYKDRIDIDKFMHLNQDLVDRYKLYLKQKNTNKHQRLQALRARNHRSPFTKVVDFFKENAMQAGT